MTRDEFQKADRGINDYFVDKPESIYLERKYALHRKYVERAFKQGQYIPPEVLKDYPDLTLPITELSNPKLESMTEIPDPPKVEYPQTGKVAMLADNLAKCLTIVKDTVGSRTLPILNKVKIDFKDGLATFTTNNLETVTVTSCGCKIESEFSCVLPFKILKDLSELLDDDVVVIKKDGPVVTFTQGRNVTTLFDADPLDYPLMPKVEGQSVVISELAETIKKIKDKIIKSTYRSHEGLFFDLSKPNIVATDGYKMKIAKLECEPKPIQFRIDKECALLLAKFKDMDCIVTSNDKATRFDFGEHMRGTLPPSIYTTIITQNLQGTYPDYETLKESNKEAVSVC
jgi:DNA polymerase III sliding clamp (beta) subunit (PCNA family)